MSRPVSGWSDGEFDDDPDDDPDEADRPESPALAAARRAYASRAVPAPGVLLDRTMETVGRELRPARRLSIDPLPGSATRGIVTDVAAGNAIRRALDGDPAVIVRRCRIEGPGRRDPGWRVWLSVAVSYAHYDRHGDRELRRRVIAAAQRLFGATVTAVDIDIVDVTPGAVSGAVSDAVSDDGPDAHGDGGRGVTGVEREVASRRDDAELTELVVAAVRDVPGVARLQRRPLTALRRVSAPGRSGADGDATAVTLLRNAGGELTIAIELASTSEPPPREVVAAVGRAVDRALAAVEEHRVDLEVVVTDVEP